MQELLPNTKSSVVPPDTGAAKAPRPAGASPARTPRFTLEQQRWSKGFFSNLKDFLTERPLKVTRSAGGGAFAEDEFGGGFFENLKEWLRPLPRSARQAALSRMEVEWKPWYRAFWENLRDAISPPKLPPIKVTSQPVKVRDIWSRDENLGRAQGLSLAVHALLVVLLIVPIYHHVIQTTEANSKTEVITVDISDISPYLAKLPPGKDRAGGGGGGGERMATPPTKGRAPRFDWVQKTPPMATLRNLNPKLPAEPTLLGPPDLKIPSPNLPNYGDPLAKLITGSGGPGGGGGIGTGCCGGIGSGEGGGLGPGSGGGTGGGPFRAGTGGVGEPACAYCPNPEFSEEARKAKYQGSVLLRLIVDADGRPTNISVLKSPGLGLDEKAIEKVRTWRFKPALGPNGKPVPVWVTVEVTFRLY